MNSLFKKNSTSTRDGGVTRLFCRNDRYEGAGTNNETSSFADPQNVRLDHIGRKATTLDIVREDIQSRGAAAPNLARKTVLPANKHKSTFHNHKGPIERPHTVKISHRAFIHETQRHTSAEKTWIGGRRHWAKQSLRKEIV
jgi:hypothetical protein